MQGTFSSDRSICLRPYFVISLRLPLASITSVACLQLGSVFERRPHHEFWRPEKLSRSSGMRSADWHLVSNQVDDVKCRSPHCSTFDCEIWAHCWICAVMVFIRTPMSPKCCLSLMGISGEQFEARRRVGCRLSSVTRLTAICCIRQFCLCPLLTPYVLHAGLFTWGWGMIGLASTQVFVGASDFQIGVQEISAVVG